MHNAQAIAANLFAVTKKRSNNPPLVAFGERLALLRNGVSREIISRKLEKLGAPIGGSTLAQYEKGRVWAPDAAVLWALAQVYVVEHEELVTLLRASRKRPAMTYAELRDLIRHEGDQASKALKGGAIDVPASAAQTRVQQLETERDEARAALREMRTLATRLVVIATGAAGDDAREEGGLSRVHQSSRGKGRRAARR